jgi:hypothetical protein
MKQISNEAVLQYVTDHIGSFHSKRLQNLELLKLSRILKHKNPYLFREKNILTCEALIITLLEAHLLSQEETIFGDFLENLAIFICGVVNDGYKSSAEGIDLEFAGDSVHFIVNIKSGPNWGNSSQIAKMKDDFRKAKRIHRTNNPIANIVAVNGCCYRKDDRPDKGDYFKYCGQRFWSFISGKPDLYIQIIEPLGHDAKAENEEFTKAYARIVNRFSLDFAQQFCSDGVINWEALLRFNSAASSDPASH